MGSELVDTIHAISYHPHKRVGLFCALSLPDQAAVLLSLTKHIRFAIVSALSDEALTPILEHLDPDEATDMLQLLPEQRRERLIKTLNEELRQHVSLLLGFDPKTAAGIMSLDYILVDAQDTIATVAKRFKAHEKSTGKLPVILVTKEDKLAGYLPGHELGFGHPKDVISKFVKTIRSIRYDAPAKEVAELFRSHPHNKVVVLGKTGNVMGVIYSDDVIHLLQEEEDSSLYDFAGLHEEESVFDPMPRKVAYRYKWLIVNLGTAFLAAFTVGFFDKTITKYVLLAVYMPIIAGMGGNAGTQTLAVMVRGIARGQVDTGALRHVIAQELGAGLINGAINGAIVAAIVIAKDGEWMIGFILAVSLVVNLLVAAFFGTVVPIIMKRLGKDPASSATIFITTATDVFGFLAFLGLASLVLD